MDIKMSQKIPYQKIKLKYKEKPFYYYRYNKKYN